MKVAHYTTTIDAINPYNKKRRLVSVGSMLSLKVKLKQDIPTIIHTHLP